MNFQNLQRGGVLRDSLYVPDDLDLVVADSGAIEARGVAWLAGQDDLVEDFRRDVDLYSKFASKVYGRHVDRKRKAHHTVTEFHDGSNRRWYVTDKGVRLGEFHNQADAFKAAEYKPDAEPGFVGKTAILGLGYGLGWAKFSDTLLKGPMGAPPIQFTEADAIQLGVHLEALRSDLEWVDIQTADVEFTSGLLSDARRRTTFNKMVSRLSREDLAIHCAACFVVVQTYRKSYFKIPQLWRTMAHAIQCMADGVEEYFGPGGVIHTKKEACVLPNGMELRYPELKYSHPVYDEDTGEEIGGGFSYYNGKERVRLYGGSFTENVVQALARIVVFDQALEWRLKHGAKIVTKSHDEVVGVVPRGQGEVALAALLSEMKTSPSWAPGWPLTAEGGFGKVYGEVK